MTGDDWRIYLLGYEVQIQRTGVYRAYVAVRLSENVNRRYALSRVHSGVGCDLRVVC